MAVISNEIRDRENHFQEQEHIQDKKGNFSLYFKYSEDRSKG